MDTLTTTAQIQAQIIDVKPFAVYIKLPNDYIAEIPRGPFDLLNLDQPVQIGDTVLLPNDWETWFTEEEIAEEEGTAIE